MRRAKDLVLTLIILICQNCATGVKQVEQLFYTDQNNNRYSIQNLMLKYKAVQPLQSSSGTYNGGLDYEVKLSIQAYTKLKQMAIELLKDSTRHSNKREKMTSFLEYHSKNKSYKALLMPSAKRSDFETFLNSFKP